MIELDHIIDFKNNVSCLIRNEPNLFNLRKRSIALKELHTTQRQQSLDDIKTILQKYNNEKLLKNYFSSDTFKKYYDDIDYINEIIKLTSSGDKPFVTKTLKSCTPLKISNQITVYKSKTDSIAKFQILIVIPVLIGILSQFIDFSFWFAVVFIGIGPFTILLYVIKEKRKNDPLKLIDYMLIILFWVIVISLVVWLNSQKMI